MFAITLKFLEAVQRNNNTERFHTNYDLYQQEKKRFWKVVQQLLDYGKSLNPNWADVQLKNCLFRFNRDIRYRTDKRPYKDHFWCEFSAQGKRSGRPCFYFELRPGGSFVGVGTWRAGKPFESKMRKYAILNFDQWKKLQTSKSFLSYYGKMLRSDPDQPYVLQEYKSMYCLKKAFPNWDQTIQSLSDQRKNLRTSKCSYQKAWELLRLMPKKEQEYYRQLCFQKDWLWEVKIEDDLLVSDVIVEELKKAMDIAMPMITFLEQGIK